MSCKNYYTEDFDDASKILKIAAIQGAKINNELCTAEYTDSDGDIIPRSNTISIFVTKDDDEDDFGVTFADVRCENCNEHEPITREDLLAEIKAFAAIHGSVGKHTEKSEDSDAEI